MNRAGAFLQTAFFATAFFAEMCCFSFRLRLLIKPPSKHLYNAQYQILPRPPYRRQENAGDTNNQRYPVMIEFKKGFRYPIIGKIKTLR